jgi:uncharacterized damage-inducible protein DinB
MGTVPPWFDRKFEFTFPVEQYPNLRVRLWGTPARLDEMLRDARPKALLRKPGEKWSAQEHAGHLLDLEPLWMSRLEDFIRGGDVLTVADLTNRKTEEANHNARPLREILLGFRKTRAELLKRLEKIEPALLSRTMLHPRLQKPMRVVDHLFFVAEHDDHHLAKIWELIQS